MLAERNDDSAADQAARLATAQAWSPNEVDLFAREPDVAGKLLDLVVREFGANPVQSGRDEAPESLAMAWHAQLLGSHECGDVFTLLVAERIDPVARE